MEKEKVKFCYLAEELKITEIEGIKVIDFYNDIDLMVSAQKKALKKISQFLDIEESGLLFCKGHVKGAEVMGCEISQPEDNEPFIRKGVINDISEVENYEVCPPDQNPIVLDLLKKAKQFYEITGIKDTIMYEGPFTIACFVRGQSNFMLDLIDNPDLCKELIRKINNSAIEWKKYHDDELGIENPEAIGLVDDSIVNVSPQIFNDMILPELIRWYDSFNFPKRHFHCCGNISNILESLSRLNIAQYDMFGEMIATSKMRNYFPGIFISKALDFRIIRDKPEETIKSYIDSECKEGCVHGNFGLCMEGIRGVSLERARIVRDCIADFNGGEVPSFEKIDGI